MDKLKILAAFEVGRWLGQVDLEESIERDQLGICAIEAIYSKKASKPLYEASNGRTVKYNLRSNKWREGVKKECKRILKEIENA